MKAHKETQSILYRKTQPHASGHSSRKVWRKPDLLRESLRGMALSLGPGRRMPTVEQLCASLHVSSSTLDPVLRSLEARGMIVRRHGSGIFVAPTVRQKMIGVVFGGDIFSPGFSPFWSLLLQAVREQAGGHAFAPQAYVDLSDGSGQLMGHARLLEDIEGHRLDGLLLLAPRHGREEVDKLSAYGLPLVLFGGTPPAGWTVNIDWDPLLRLAGSELARQGCRRIGLLAPSVYRPSLEDALRQAGAGEVRIDDWSYDTWVAIIPGAGTRENCAHLLTQRMIDARGTTPLPEALVSIDDTMTRGAITALLQAGMRPGCDIRIVTAENKGSPVLAPWAADLTRVAIDPKACVKAALAMLETLMAGGTPAENPVWVRPEQVSVCGCGSVGVGHLLCRELCRTSPSHEVMKS